MGGAKKKPTVIDRALSNLRREPLVEVRKRK